MAAALGADIGARCSIRYYGLQSGHWLAMRALSRVSEHKGGPRLNSNGETVVGKYIVPATIGAVAALATGWATFLVEDRKADAEFAQIALSILAADGEAQNTTARAIAIQLLAESLPIELSTEDQEAWLSGGDVLLELNAPLGAEYLRRIQAEWDANIEEYLGPRVSPKPLPQE